MIECTAKSCIPQLNYNNYIKSIKFFFTSRHNGRTSPKKPYADHPNLPNWEILWIRKRQNHLKTY